MTYKNTALCLLFFNLVLLTKANAEILRWPQLCPSGKLRIENRTNVQVRTWIQNFKGENRIETEVILPAKGHADVLLETHTAEERFTLMHFENPQKISATFVCEKNSLFSQAQSLEGGQLIFVKSDLTENKIWLQNLYSDVNIIHIEYLDLNRKMIGEDFLTLKSFEQQNFKVQNRAYARVRISAENRFTAFSLISSGSQNPKEIEIGESHPDRTAHYFLVAPRDGVGDSFVVRIQNPEMTARARELVLHPELEKIVFAKIEKGHQGFNRNWSKPEKSFWSWSATEVTNFDDIGSSACNGIPQLVEDEINNWAQDPGRICFWNYRIKKELSSDEVALPRH